MKFRIWRSVQEGVQQEQVSGLRDAIERLLTPVGEIAFGLEVQPEYEDEWYEWADENGLDVSELVYAIEDGDVTIDEAVVGDYEIVEEDYGNDNNVQ